MPLSELQSSAHVKISVIVPVYNTEKYLRRCVDSILSQTFANFELLLIDDGSKDASGAICDDYAANDPRVRVFHKQNGGVSSARNFGIDNARGEWISFVDSDDWLDKTFLEILLYKAQSANADVVFCDSFFEFTNKRYVYNHYDWKKSGREGLAEFICSTWTCLWGCLVKCSLLSRNNLYCPAGVSYCEDFHLVVRICFFASKIIKVSKALYHYYQRETSAVHNLSPLNIDEELRAYSEISRFFRFHGVEDDFKRVMAWRMLKASQSFALDVRSFREFKSLNSENKVFIFGCPFVTRIGQLNMWLLTHRLTFFSVLYVLLRKYLMLFRLCKNESSHSPHLL